MHKNFLNKNDTLKSSDHDSFLLCKWHAGMQGIQHFIELWSRLTLSTTSCDAVIRPSVYISRILSLLHFLVNNI